MRPARGVPGVDEAAQLLAPAHELAALGIRARRPLDREAHVVGDEAERGVRLRPVEGLEVALEERHAAMRGRAVASGLTPIIASARAMKNSRTWSRPTRPLGRYQCQTLL